jgi:hypothetical protein
MSMLDISYLCTAGCCSADRQQQTIPERPLEIIAIIDQDVRGNVDTRTPSNHNFQLFLSSFE